MYLLTGFRTTLCVRGPFIGNSVFYSGYAVMQLDEVLAPSRGAAVSNPDRVTRIFH